MPDKKLKIFGDGVDRERLEKIADGASNIEFLGRVSDEDLVKYYANAQGFINPQEEDFGITAVEAMSAGCPVIAYKKGGATETVIDGETGLFFENQNVADIKKAVSDFDKNKFDSEKISEHASKYSSEVFQEKIKEFVDRKTKEAKNS